MGVNSELEVKTKAVRLWLTWPSFCRSPSLPGPLRPPIARPSVSPARPSLSSFLPARHCRHSLARDHLSLPLRSRLSFSRLLTRVTIKQNTHNRRNRLVADRLRKTDFEARPRQMASGEEQHDKTHAFRTKATTNLNPSAPHCTQQTKQNQEQKSGERESKVTER